MIQWIRDVLGMPAQKCGKCDCLEQRVKGVERRMAETSLTLKQGLADIASEVEAVSGQQDEVLAEMLKSLTAVENENAMLLMEVAAKDQEIQRLQEEMAHILMYIAKEEN